jgi:hypothetical protein
VDEELTTVAGGESIERLLVTSPNRSGQCGRLGGCRWQLGSIHGFASLFSPMAARLNQ